jgi:hypothetical protein
MLCAPHHVQSIPARAAHGNHGAKHFVRLHSTDNITPYALTFAYAALYSALGGFVTQALRPLRFRGRLRKSAQSRVPVLPTTET